MNNVTYAAHTSTQPLPWIWFFVILAILLFFCALCFLQFFNCLSRSRMVTDTPHSKLRSAAQGFVKVQGVVNSLFTDAVLIAPLTKKQCCWYRYTIEQEITTYDNKGNRQTEWQTIEEGHSADLFHMKDETGDCVVFPVGADVTTTANETWYTGGFLSTSFSGMFNFVPGGGQYRYSEHRLEPGQNTIILGFFETRDAKENPAMEHQDAIQNDPQKLEALQKKHSFLAKAGINFLAFQKQKMDVAGDQWQKFSADKNQINLLSNHLLQKRPFIISDLDLKKLVAHYRWSTLGFGMGFIALGIGAIVLTFFKMTGKI